MIQNPTRTAFINYVSLPAYWTCYRRKSVFNLNYFLFSFLAIFIIWGSFAIVYFYGADILIQAFVWLIIGILISKYIK